MRDRYSGYDFNQNLGTTDSPTFAGRTITGCSVLGLNSTVFQPTTDSTTFFQILDADGGTPIFNIDSTNERAGFGTATPVDKLSVAGGSISVFPTTTEGLQVYRRGSTTTKAITIGADASADVVFDTVNATYHIKVSGNEKVTILSTGKVGINDAGPGEMLDVGGNTNVTGVYKVDDVQVVSNRVIDARCDDAIDSGDGTTDGVIDALRDAMITHGLIAAS